jgi:hypothetical protein
MTTRAKLAEVSGALLAAAPAASGTHAAAGGAHGHAGSSGGGGSCSAAALPLQPWAWPLSAQCGCKAKGPTSSNGSSSGSHGGSHSRWGSAMLAVGAPSLQTVLQEMANSAASVHRRVMLHVRARESRMRA